VSPLCPFGCGALDTVHHVFVTCPTFHHLRRDAYSSLIHALFRDSRQWPQNRSRFYLGVLPKLPEINTITPPRARDRVIRRIASIWHSEAIRLAGRIWGDYKR
ncbi:hypothetical protein BDZ89DRAFT_987420, partial [Hymenopellis radicata]